MERRAPSTCESRRQSRHLTPAGMQHESTYGTACPTAAPKLAHTSENTLLVPYLLLLSRRRR